MSVDLVDHVRGLRAQPTAALRRVAPPRRDFARGVGEHRDVQQERRELGRADLAPGDDSRRRCLARRPAELGAEQVHDAGRVGGVEHPARLRGVTGERLLAQHVLPGGDGLERDRRVGVRRRRDRDRVDTGERERVGEGRAARSGRRSAPRVPTFWPGSRPTSACTSNPASRSARRCVMQPNPVPTMATPVIVGIGSLA